MTVITFLDKLHKEDKDAAFRMASEATGSSPQTTFFITNHNTYEHDKAPFEVDRTALDILDFAVVAAENFIKIRKQREKNQLEREVIAGGNELCFPSCNESISLSTAHIYSCAKKLVIF